MDLACQSKVGGEGSAAAPANVPGGGVAAVDCSPSMDTQVTHDGSQTTITITSVTTVVI